MNTRVRVGSGAAAGRRALDLRTRQERRGHCQEAGQGAQATTPTRSGLRRAIAAAQDFDQLGAVADGLRATAVSLHDVRVAPGRASGTISMLADSFTRRSIELSISELGPPPFPLSWVALGSHGRREPVPGSDIDSALAWDGDEQHGEAKSYMLGLGARVSEALARCGFAADKRGATAANDLFVRPVSAWRGLIRESIKQPRKGKGLIVISLFLDGRVLHDGGGLSDLHQEFLAARDRRGLLRLMLSQALAHKPPVGYLRDFVVERSGEHRGRLDIKQRGLLPVTSIARYASLATGATAPRSTPDRLSAAEAGGTLDSHSARSLSDAFELFQGLRLEHQVAQIEREIEPDDYLDPKALNPVQRGNLRDAFRQVRAVQKELGGRLSSELAFG